MTLLGAPTGWDLVGWDLVGWDLLVGGAIFLACFVALWGWAFRVDRGRRRSARDREISRAAQAGFDKEIAKGAERKDRG